jgi:hypothetical protein
MTKVESQVMLLTVLAYVIPLSLADPCGQQECQKAASLHDEVSLIQTQSHLNSRVTPKSHSSRKSTAARKDGEEHANTFKFWGRDARIVTNKTSLLGILPNPKIQIDPPHPGPMMLHHPTHKSYSQYGQDLTLHPILELMGPGFFVESGALNGETDSNTLLYELYHNWTGLLIEPNSRMYPKLLSKHRHAYSFNGCLSPSGKMEAIYFDKGLDGADGAAHISSFSLGSETVLAAPLEMLLQKIGRSTVDFWSLDIEGSEGQVLQNTNFSKVEVGVLLIEMNKNGGNNEVIYNVMNREGFQKIGHTNYWGGILDHIFVNPKYFEKRGMDVPTAMDISAGNRDLESSAHHSSLSFLVRLSGLFLGLSMLT